MTDQQNDQTKTLAVEIARRAVESGSEEEWLAAYAALLADGASHEQAAAIADAIVADTAKAADDESESEAP